MEGREERVRGNWSGFSDSGPARNCGAKCLHWSAFRGDITSRHLDAPMWHFPIGTSRNAAGYSGTSTSQVQLYKDNLCNRAHSSNSRSGGALVKDPTRRRSTMLFSTWRVVVSLCLTSVPALAGMYSQPVVNLDSKTFKTVMATEHAAVSMTAKQLSFHHMRSMTRSCLKHFERLTVV